jgi:uncharacterized protein with GYD domain
VRRTVTAGEEVTTMKYVSLFKLSAEGRKQYPQAGPLFTKCLEITDKLGGKVLETYAITGSYDFISITEYPTPEIAFENRLKLYELGIFDVIDSHEAFDMDLYLAKV